MESLVHKGEELILEKLASLPKPTCELDHLRFRDVNTKDATMGSTLTIQNPYDHDLPVVLVTYKVLSNNREIGSGQISDAGDIKASDKTDLDLTTVVEYKFLWDLVKDIGSDWDIDYRLEVGVQLNLPIVGKFTIPVDHSGTLKLPTFGDIF